MLSYFLGNPPELSLGGLTVRIGEDAQRSVVFFGTPSPTKEGVIDYGGTGFFVGYRDSGTVFSYLATCRHVAEAVTEKLRDDEAVTLRANLKSGGSVPFKLVKADWYFPDDASVDLAITGADLPFDQLDQIYFILDDEAVCVKAQTPHVGCGDEINIVGLFRLHAGNRRNVAFVHTGHVAVLPDPDELVPIVNRRTDKRTESEVYLVQANTLNGLSGSPVFLQEPIDVERFGVIDSDGTLPKLFGLIKLLGIYSGSWDAEPGMVLGADRNLGGSVKVPIGMGTVVPIEKLIRLLEEHPVLVSQRKNFLDQHRDENVAMTDSAFSPSKKERSPKPDENPNHKEDFTALLDAAARKQK